MHFVFAIIAFIAVWLYFGLHKDNPNRPGLPQVEQSYYEQVFDYTMDNIPAGSHFDWQTYDANGSISIDKAFISPSGYTCRSFAESYTVGGHAQGDTGYACKRVGREGWCKLAPTNALTCAMENPSYHVSIPGMNVAAPNAPGVNMNAPNMPGASMDISMPQRNKTYGDKDPSATEAANTITGTAGNAAGYVARNAGGWFSSLFR
jgi:hypothetical protein